ncbi:unnamed protein product, partial [Prorocentrum cordatum]
PSGLQGFVLRAKTPRGEQAPRPRTRAPRDGETTMAASSRAASIALFALALLCQPCATADADCKAEEREDEAALLQAESAARRSAARRSSAAGAGGHAQAANSTSGAVSDAASQKCGVIYIADSWTCCKDAHGNGIGAAPGSTCCLSPVTGGVLACGAGSVCNPSSGLCFAPGSSLCGPVACAPGTVCTDQNTGICVVPGTAGTAGPTDSAGSEADDATNGTAE